MRSLAAESTALALLAGRPMALLAGRPVDLFPTLWLTQDSADPHVEDEVDLGRRVPNSQGGLTLCSPLRAGAGTPMRWVWKEQAGEGLGAGACSPLSCGPWPLCALCPWFGFCTIQDLLPGNQPSHLEQGPPAVTYPLGTGLSWWKRGLRAARGCRSAGGAWTPAVASAVHPAGGSGGSHASQSPVTQRASHGGCVGCSLTCGGVWLGLLDQGGPS